MPKLLALGRFDDETSRLQGFWDWELCGFTVLVFRVFRGLGWSLCAHSALSTRRVANDAAWEQACV